MMLLFIIVIASNILWGGSFVQLIGGSHLTVQFELELKESLPMAKLAEHGLNKKSIVKRISRLKTEKIDFLSCFFDCIFCVCFFLERKSLPVVSFALLLIDS